MVLRTRENELSLQVQGEVEILEREFMSKFRNVTFSVGLFAGIGSPSAMAIPHVYQCRVVDYLDTGVMSTDFQYIVGSGYRSVKSTNSEVRVNYSKQDGVLSISLRHLNNVESYARREDQGTPQQVSLTHVDLEHAATVRCKL